MHHPQFITPKFKPFMITVDTTQAGSAANTFVLPLVTGSNYNFIVEWGDGTQDNITAFNQAELTHVYGANGTYQISITGVMDRIYFNNAGDKAKLITIDQWGDIRWKSFSGAFFGCLNMNGAYSDVPSMDDVMDMFAMFTFCSSFNYTVLGWNTSLVTKFQSTFQSCTIFNQPIDWDTGSGSNFLGFLSTCPAFDQNLAAMDITSAGNLGSFLAGGTLSTANYNALLIGWEGQAEPSGLTFSAGSSTYTETAVDSGTTDSTTANKLDDSTQNFLTTVSIGDIVHNTTDGTFAKVTAVDSDTVLSISVDIMTTGENYVIQSSAAAKARFELDVPSSWTIADGGGV